LEANVGCQNTDGEGRQRLSHKSTPFCDSHSAHQALEHRENERGQNRLLPDDLALFTAIDGVAASQNPLELSSLRLELEFCDDFSSSSFQNPKNPENSALYE
jgi:hypothetical protein